MSFNGWAVRLNGVMLVLSCDVTQDDWDDLDCAPATVLDGLTSIPSGLDLPSLRTEDVVYFQRDGVKHFSDWYEPRVITVQGMLGPLDESCPDCSTVRQQLQELVQAWKRTCCDTELVIFPDCYTTDLTTGDNLYSDGTFDVDTDGWLGEFGATVARVTSPVQSGAGALEITWDDDPVPYDDPGWSGQRAYGPTLAVTQGVKYRVSAWLYADDTEPSPVLGVSDEDGDAVVYSDPVVADGTWHLVEIDYWAPASGELVPFVVNGEATVVGDLAYLDGVEVFAYADVNRDLNGPFGVIGRPREFKYNWVDRKEQIVEFVGRFDAVDHRMYVLDQCGTEGYAECVEIQPGTQLYSRCYEDGTGIYAGKKVRCYGPSGTRCYSTPVTSDDSVPATALNIGGTERVFPTVVLQPNLDNPRIENVDTGEYIAYNAVVGDSPVTINTEEGTAFDSEGNSKTHLLSGSLFLSLDPGAYYWRLLSTGDPDPVDPGYASVCWRNTVVNA